MRLVRSLVITVLIYREKRLRSIEKKLHRKILKVNWKSVSIIINYGTKLHYMLVNCRLINHPSSYPALVTVLPLATLLVSWFISSNLFLPVSGNIEKLIKPGSSYEHVARWLTFCGAQSPFCNVSEKLPSQALNDSSQLGVSVLPLLQFY